LWTKSTSWKHVWKKKGCSLCQGSPQKFGACSIHIIVRNKITYILNLNEIKKLGKHNVFEEIVTLVQRLASEYLYTNKNCISPPI